MLDRAENIDVASIDDELRCGIKKEGKKYPYDRENAQRNRNVGVYRVSVLMGTKKRPRKESFAGRETEKSFPGA